MLNSCKSRYVHVLKNLENNVSGLTERYYGMSGVPEEVADEVSTLNEKIAKCEQNIKDINTAIDVMSSDICDCNQP